MINKTLVCFTASYPYGERETYFENELYYLSKCFKNVVLIPTYNPFSSEKRTCPDNVQVFDITLRQGKFKFIDGVSNLKVKRVFLSEFIKYRVYKDPLRFKNWLLAVFSYGVGLNKFLSYKFKPNDVILYSYWAGQSFFPHPKLSAFTKVIRMHGADFYEERNRNYLPLRQQIYNSAQLLLPISKDIQTKLISRYNIQKEKIALSYLGTKNYATFCNLKDSPTLRFISCSNVYALKRLHLIFQILKSINKNLELSWIHIGDGEMLEELKMMIALNNCPNLTIDFLEQKNQMEIQEIYKNYYFDFFINTSLYEGLPVSIMEAFSFGIPAIATNVGGTSEIVNSENGVLIDKDFDPKEVAETIVQIYNNNLNNLRVNAWKTWKEKFDAEKNYERLIDTMKQINNS